MPILVQHDGAHDALHLVLQRDRIIARTEWITDYATIDIAYDGEPIGINIHFYYTKKMWPLTEEMVKQYGLEGHLDDLAIVWENFFAPPSFAVKSIHYEGPDGNEVIVKTTEQALD